jgi:hypothetical protein
MSFEDFSYSPSPLTSKEEMEMKKTIQTLLKNPHNSSALLILREFQHHPISEEFFLEIYPDLLQGIQSENISFQRLGFNFLSENFILFKYSKHQLELNEIILHNQSNYLKDVNVVINILKIYSDFESSLITKSLPFLVKCSETNNHLILSKLIKVYLNYFENYENICNIIPYNIVEFILQNENLSNNAHSCILRLINGNSETRDFIFKNKEKYDLYSMKNGDIYQYIMNSHYFKDKKKILFLDYFISFPFTHQRKSDFNMNLKEWNNQLYFIYNGKINIIPSNSRDFKPETDSSKGCFQFSMSKEFLLNSKRINAGVSLYKIEDYLKGNDPIFQSNGNSITGINIKIVKNLKALTIHLFSTNNCISIKSFNFNGDFVSSQEIDGYRNYYSITSNEDGSLIVLSTEEHLWKLTWNNEIKQHNFDCLTDVEHYCESLDINKTSTLLVGYNRKDLTIYDLENGNELYYFIFPLSEIPYYPKFSKSNGNLIFFFDFNSLKIFEIDEFSTVEGKDLSQCLVQIIQLKMIDKQNRLICESQDEKFIFLGNNDGIWKLKTIQKDFQQNLHESFKNFNDIIIKYLQ